MKRIVFFCALFLALALPKAQAQFQGPGDRTASLALTSGYYWGDIGLQGSYDVGIHEFFSVGGQVNLDFNDDLGVFLGARGNFHLLSALEADADQFDVYLGATLGMRIDDGVKLGAGGHVGFRWNFDPKWALYTEIGSGGAFGVAVKL